MRDIKCNHVADADIVSLGNVKISMLIHHPSERPVLRRSDRLRAPRPVMHRRNRQPGIERRVSLAQSDDGLFLLGQLVHVSPKLQSRLQAWFHAPRYRVANLDLLLGGSIHAYVVG
jgi:hypothetical protein